MNKKEKRTINAANEREVMNSKRNALAIEQAISSTTATMRELGEALNATYSECDRRFKKYDDALVSLNDALRALETLKAYEEDTIALCMEG